MSFEYESQLANQQDHSLKIILKGGTDDLWVVKRLNGQEEISQPYCYVVDLQSQQLDIAIKDYVGTKIAVEFNSGDQLRYFSGIVGEIEQGLTINDDDRPTAQYRLKIYPSLWLLKFTQDCQIFQNHSAIQIIKQVLEDNGVERISDKTATCGQTVREYCVQYRESSFNFISRLMEEEGIFYYFEHNEDGETLVLTDDSLSAPTATAESLTMVKGFAQEPNFNQIISLTIAHQVVANGFSQADYNFETASVKLFSIASGQGQGGMIYNYPGIYKISDDGDALATNRVQELEWFKETVRGESTCSLFAPMYAMAVTGHPRAEANNTYVLYKVHHDINLMVSPNQFIYKNYYEAFPADVPFRPKCETVKPIIASTQTAIVTGKEDEEIWCDEYGRIKVKFHWDQSDVTDEKSSCWIRVAQLWASSGWGGLWTPRVGMEVVVTFLEGDPDRPLITGCVYNSDNMPPYASDQPTKSTIRSNTTKESTGFNEIRFEDLKDSEEIFIHAQKDHNTVVEDNRTLKINDGDDTSDIMAGDRIVTLHAEDRDEKPPNRGNDTLTLTKGSRRIYLNAEGEEQGDHLLELTKGDATLHITKGNHVINLDEGDQNMTVVGNVTHTVSKDYNLTIEGSLTITVTKGIVIKSGEDIELAAGGNIKLSAGSDISLDATKSVFIEALNSVSAEAGIDVSAKAGAGLSLTAAGALEISGDNITAKGTSGITLKSDTTLTADAAASAKVTAAGTLDLKGAIVNIN